MTRENVLKMTALVLTGVMAAGAVGCGSASSTTTTAGTSAAATTTTAAATTKASTTKAATTTTAAAEKVSGQITAAGSSALLPLVQDAADAFMAENPDCVISVTGGGSGQGLKQVSDGAVDIGNSDVFAEEKLDADAAAQLEDHQVCTITMAAIVNKDLGVTNLSTDDLVKIFTGEITNWSEVGGPDEDIMLITRPSSSGTRALFKTYALNGAEEASASALETDDSGTLLQNVQDNANAIGYVALSYLVNNTEVQAVSIDGVAPTLENTYNGTYKVWGYEHMYTRKDADNTAAEAFISYMMGDTYSTKLESMGYGVTSKMSDTAIASHE
ncbi:MAG: phosphate ABC transporter substrate-binding protein [Lachnospiraceae bacterium]|jgi:phosphate transport system substrate-binding protein